MTLHEKHCNILDRVNNSKTEDEHQRNMAYLRAWRDGVKDAGREVVLVDADWYYIEQGYDAPMCCGVWLDWEPGIHSENATGERRSAE